MFNSTPTFLRRDFDCGCLLSLCFYDLLETPGLPTTPRPYGNGPLVLAQSDSISFQSQTLDLCDLVSHQRLAILSPFDHAWGGKIASRLPPEPCNRPVEGPGYLESSTHMETEEAGSHGIAACFEMDSERGVNVTNDALDITIFGVDLLNHETVRADGQKYVCPLMRCICSPLETN